MNFWIILIIASLVLILIIILIYIFRERIKKITLFGFSNLDRFDINTIKSIFSSKDKKQIFNRLQEGTKIVKDKSANSQEKKQVLTQKKQEEKKPDLTQKKQEDKNTDNLTEKKPKEQKISKTTPKNESNKPPKANPAIIIDEQLKNIQLKNQKDIYLYVKNKDFIDVLQFLESKNIVLLKNFNFEKIFRNQKELEEFLKNILIGFLNDSAEELKSKISDLIRKGKDVNDIRLSLMSVPLKIKIFSASLNLKDLSVVLDRLDEIRKQLKQFS